MEFVFPDDVNGMLSFQEGKLLWQLAQINPQLGAVVELGTFQGKSTICLAQGSKKVNGGKVFTFDIFCSKLPSGSLVDFHKLFKTNVKRHHLEDWIVGSRGDTVESVKKWNQPIRLLFIDADHSYKQVLRDYDAWEKYLLPGGIIAFHDSLFWPGVNKFVYQLIKSGKYKNFVTFTKFSSPGMTYAIKDQVNELVPIKERVVDMLKFKIISLPNLFSRIYLNLREREESDIRHRIACVIRKFYYKKRGWQ